MLSSGQFRQLAPYITRAPDRSLVVVDTAADTVYKITPEGVTTVLLSREQIAKAIPNDVELLGGIAFDDDEKLYLVDNASDSVLQFDDKGKGKVWVTAEKIQEVTGVRPNLDSGIAFECRSVVSAGWTLDQPITLQDLLCIAGIDPNDPAAPLTISLDELIENILERYSELFWLQTRRRQSVSPFAP